MSARSVVTEVSRPLDRASEHLERARLNAPASLKAMLDAIGREVADPVHLVPGLPLQLRLPERLA